MKSAGVGAPQGTEELSVQGFLDKLGSIPQATSDEDPDTSGDGNFVN